MVCLYVSSFPVVCLCQCAVLSHKQFVALPVLAERFEVCRQHLQALAYATCLHGADCHTAHATDAKDVVVALRIVRRDGSCGAECYLMYVHEDDCICVVAILL